jgi:hypothetical protein
VGGAERCAGRHRSVGRFARCAAELCTQLRVPCLSRCSRGFGSCHALSLFEGRIPCGRRQLRLLTWYNPFCWTAGIAARVVATAIHRSYVTQKAKSVHGPACKRRAGPGYQLRDFARCGVQASAGAAADGVARLEARRQRGVLIVEAYRAEVYRSQAEPPAGCDLRAPSVPVALVNCPQSTGRGARQFHVVDSQHDSAWKAHSFRATGQKRRASNSKAVECVVLPCAGPPDRGPYISHEPLTL